MLANISDIIVMTRWNTNILTLIKREWAEDTQPICSIKVSDKMI